MILYEHFGENRVILLQRLQNDGAINFAQFFSEPLCII